MDTIQMTEEEVKAVRAIVDYMWEDENQHWQELEQPENHIFNSVDILKNWLTKNYGKN